MGHVAAINMLGKNADSILSALIALALVSSVSAMIMVGPRVYEVIQSRLVQSALLAVAIVAGGCRHETTHSSQGPAGTERAVASARPSAVASGQVHDPAHPPIDCPLHKLGVDPAHVRPFEDVEKYIAFLEKPERAVWQKPDEVIAALGLAGSETVVDIGAGSGYFTFRFARALPKGKVIAEDTEAEMVRHVHHRVMTEGISNIHAVLSRPEAPEIASDADWVFICDVLHHVPDRPAWLSRIASGMKPGARLALVEFKEGPLPEGPPESAKIPRAQLLSLFNSAGFSLDSEKPDLLPYQVFLIFRRP